MDICHLKNAELEAKHQKYKGRVVLRGDVVKDDSESYSVFTEQGSSASQMTAAKIMDIISRLPGCDGQAADAVSAYTQVKMEYAHKLLKIPNWECLFVHREKGLFLSVYVDDLKLAGKKQNLDPMWKLLIKEVDLGEPTSFLDHVHLGCTQRQCEISKDTVDNYRTMFESRISAGV